MEEAAAYGATQIEPSPIAALFLSGGSLIAVILWLQKDARRTGVGAVQDWGAGLLGLIGAAYVSWTFAAYVVWHFGAGV